MPSQSLPGGGSTYSYYISNAGHDDTGDGSIGNPWATLTKVNSLSLLPSTTVYFRRGDTFVGTLTVSASVSPESRLFLMDMDQEANPIITGVELYRRGLLIALIYIQVVLVLNLVPNIVSLDGVNTGMGIYPDVELYNTYSSFTNATTIYDSSLPNSPSFVGGELVLRPYSWEIDRCTINSQSSGTINYTNPGGNSPYGDMPGYFIQNHINTLTTTVEWYCNGSTFYMYFGSNDPGSHVVKLPVYDYLLTISGHNYITANNIDFEYGNQSIGIYF